jgi:hypothetical protein
VLHGKLEARPFFFLYFKGTPSQEEPKTIFRGLGKINGLYLAIVTPRLFSTVRYTLRDTYNDFPQSDYPWKSIFLNMVA